MPWYNNNDKYVCKREERSNFYEEKNANIKPCITFYRSYLFLLLWNSIYIYKYSRFWYFKYYRSDFLGLSDARNLASNYSASDTLIYVKKKIIYMCYFKFYLNNNCESYAVILYNIFACVNMFLHLFFQILIVYSLLSFLLKVPFYKSIFTTRTLERLP